MRFHLHEVKKAKPCRERPEEVQGIGPVLFLPQGCLHHWAHFTRIHWAGPQWYVPLSVSVWYFQGSFTFLNHGNRKSDSALDTTLRSPVGQCAASAVSLWWLILAIELSGTASLLFCMLGPARSYTQDREVMSQGMWCGTVYNRKIAAPTWRWWAPLLCRN